MSSSYSSLNDRDNVESESIYRLTNEKESKIMMTKEERMNELMGKVQSGEMTMEQALTAAMEAGKESREPVDRIAAVESMDSIEVLGVAYKRASCKLASAKRRAGDKYETNASYLKYQAELNAIKAKKNSLYSTVASLDDEALAAVKVGASDSAILQAAMRQINSEIKDKLLILRDKHNLTNGKLNESINKQPNKAPKQLLDRLNKYKEGLSALYLTRNSEDQFVKKLNKSYNTVLAILAAEKKSEKKDDSSSK